MVSQPVILGVWLAGLAIQVILAVVCIVRRKWVDFPMFTGYALYTLGENGVLLAIYHRPSLYFYVYVLGESIAVVLGLALVYEMFTRLFSLHTGLRRLAWLSFRLTVVLLLLLAGAVIYSRTPVGKDGVGAALLLVEEAARILEVGLITFVFLFSSVFGLHWRQAVFGIALGLGIVSVGELVAVTIAPHVGLAIRQSLNLGQMLTFDFGMFVWLGYAFLPERALKAAELPKRAQLEQWNQAIMELIHQ